MKTIILYISILILLSCKAPTKENLIQGEWIITTWVDARINRDRLKTEGAPSYVVLFKKDSVHVFESEKNKTHKYKFKWDIHNDSLRVGSLGIFNFVSIDEKKCILDIRTRNIFTEESELYLETLTLIKK